MGRVCVIGKVIRIEENRISVEVYISPIHKTSEIIVVHFDNIDRRAIREGTVVAVKAQVKRRFLIYDVKTLIAQEITPLSPHQEDLFEEYRRNIERTSTSKRLHIPMM